MAYGVEYQLYCPMDQIPMEKRNERGVTVDVCPRCGGMFLDHGELQQIIATLSSQPGYRPVAAHQGGGYAPRRAYHRSSSGGLFGSFFGSS